MTVHVLVPQCAEPRERWFELFRMQNSQNFPRLRPWIPLGRAYSATTTPNPPPPPDTPKKLLHTAPLTLI